MLSMVVCTTWRWQKSGRLVQEINVCTVGGKHGIESITVAGAGILVSSGLYLPTGHIFVEKFSIAHHLKPLNSLKLYRM